MRLSSLGVGGYGYILEIVGDDNTRRKLYELGFVKGQRIDVIASAPLQDPIKCKIMGCELSLRRDEADRIEITQDKCNFYCHGCSMCGSVYNQSCYNKANMPCKHLSVVLIGNPNCGKTSLFNYISDSHEHVGNYAGVTVDAKEADTVINGCKVRIVDLPGTYSLYVHSPETECVLNYIVNNRPDVVINVINSTNLRKNLYLTTHLMDIGIPLVGALSMYDEFKNSGDYLDYHKLGELFGMTMSPIVANRGDGVDQLLAKVISIGHDSGVTYGRSVYYGEYIEHAIAELSNRLDDTNFDVRYPKRYVSISILGHNTCATKVVYEASLLSIANKLTKEIENGEAHGFYEIAITDARYGFINGALKESCYAEGKTVDKYTISDAIDKVVINKWISFPLLFMYLFVMFKVTFTGGQYVSNIIEIIVGKVLAISLYILPAGIIKDMLTGGIIPGIGSVIVFLPQMLILYTFLSFISDIGYMPRAAFIMDKLMHKVGLHGQSFVPLIMGFGCNVPSILSTRVIENHKNKLITILVAPFISCSARLPIYIMLVGIFFAREYRLPIIIVLYTLGILIAATTCKVLSVVFKDDNSLFVMELPPYRLPNVRQIAIQAWINTKQYITKMWTTILFASVTVWAMGYFPHDYGATPSQQIDQSFIGKIGKAIEPMFRPLGFNWKMDIALLTGTCAKETIVSTLTLLYDHDDSMMASMCKDGITKSTILAFLVFVLLYFPCVATLFAIRQEVGIKLALIGLFYTTLIAWILSFIVYRCSIIICI